MFSAAKVQRKSETTKCLADFLVFCSYVKISKSDEARAEQQARLIAMPSRGCFFSVSQRALLFTTSSINSFFTLILYYLKYFILSNESNIYSDIGRIGKALAR